MFATAHLIPMACNMQYLITKRIAKPIKDALSIYRLIMDAHFCISNIGFLVDMINSLTPAHAHAKT